MPAAEVKTRGLERVLQSLRLSSGLAAVGGNGGQVLFSFTCFLPVSSFRPRRSRALVRGRGCWEEVRAGAGCGC